MYREKMKNRVIAIIVITPLLLSFQIQTSHAVDKVGATCTMVGSKSVVGKTTLSCIKSGNKLVWTKLTDPTPTPSPTFTCPDGSCGNPNISVPLNPSEISKLKKEIEALQKEIEALKTKYSQTKDLKEKKSINNRMAELTKKIESLNTARVTGESTETSSKKKPTPSPYRSKHPWEYFIGGEAIKDEIDGLQAKYNQTKNAKEKESINNKIAELEKKLEGLIKKEIEGLKAKYNQTKDAKEKDSIAKRIDELTRQLQSRPTKIILNEQSD